jgi:hypothetical protein
MIQMPNDYRHQARETVKGIGRPAMLTRRLSILRVDG